jgi:hypothetical protein
VSVRGSLLFALNVFLFCSFFITWFMLHTQAFAWMGPKCGLPMAP